MSNPFDMSEAARRRLARLREEEGVERPDALGGALKGALSGASTGMAVGGPKGAAAGALLGAAAGGIAAKRGGDSEGLMRSADTLAQRFGDDEDDEDTYALVK